MVDLHSHILFGLDDGAASMDVSVAMARIAVEDGVRIMACTPHIHPGVYWNEPRDIHDRVGELAETLKRLGIPLQLVAGADVHISPDLLGRLAGDTPPTLGNTRYFLFEPPHHVLPPRLEKFCVGLVNAGFVPILTHPERLTWVGAHFDVIEDLARNGVLIQVTAGSLAGDFGRAARTLAWRLVDDGLCDIIASDAHNTTSRKPSLSKARALVADHVGEAEADRMVNGCPSAILSNQSVKRLAAPGGRDRSRLRRDPSPCFSPKALFGRSKGTAA